MVSLYFVLIWTIEVKVSLKHSKVIHSALFGSHLSTFFFSFSPPGDILLQREITEDISFQSLGIFHINSLTQQQTFEDTYLVAAL